MAYLLEVDDLHTFFKTKKGIVKAVNGVSYRVEPGKTSHSHRAKSWGL